MQSYDTRFGLQTQPNNPQFKYENHIHDIYRGFFVHHVAVDIISEHDTLRGYRVIFVPSMYLLSGETVVNLTEFVRTGGIVVFTPRTGVKDQANAVVNMKLPGLAAELCGVVVDEYNSLSFDDQETIHFEIPGHEGNFTISVWSEILETHGAEVVASYQQGEFAGKPAITRNRFGEGQVIYVGVFSDQRFYERIANWLVSEAKVSPPLPSSLGIEITERWQGDQRLLFLINHLNQPRQIRLNREYIDLITNQFQSGTFDLGARDVMILKLRSEVE